MNIASNLSEHWTDERLIELIYGIGSETGHIETCGYCRGRLNAMRARRQTVDALAAVKDVPANLLATQRRNIYARIDRASERESGWFHECHVRRWAAAGAMVALLGGAMFLVEQRQDRQLMQNRLSDAQLAQEVSQIAIDQEPAPAAPLQGLFDD